MHQPYDSSLIISFAFAFSLIGMGALVLFLRFTGQAFRLLSGVSFVCENRTRLSRVDLGRNVERQRRMERHYHFDCKYNWYSDYRYQSYQ
jgi:hypothetical protein